MTFPRTTTTATVQPQTYGSQAGGSEENVRGNWVVIIQKPCIYIIVAYSLIYWKLYLMN